MSKIGSFNPLHVLDLISSQKSAMISFVEQLVLAESPSHDASAQKKVQSILAAALSELDYDVRLVPGSKTGGHLYAGPRSGTKRSEKQLLLGHCDTVWPIGTLERMPFTVSDKSVKGPGVYDMKGGLTQMIFALRALGELDLEPVLEPVILINSDEEIGSDESGPYIEKLARQVARVFVLEPSLGPTGKLKTARKGVGRFKITATGKAAHAGLDPEKGVSAILELSRVILKLFAMNDLDRGISVNVGKIEGGLRPNVIAPTATADVDVRVPTLADAREIESTLFGLEPSLPRTTLEVRGSVDRPPMERTDANMRLWKLARQLGRSINLELEEGSAGGGSDGNITSQYTATLDGLGAVGDGAHAEHEYLLVEAMIERCALLALLLLSPREGVES